MRISDWSSDVCSSDLADVERAVALTRHDVDVAGHRRIVARAGGGLTHIVTLGLRDEGPEHATERLPWMLGSSTSMTVFVMARLPPGAAVLPWRAGSGGGRLRASPCSGSRRWRRGGGRGAA